MKFNTITLKQLNTHKIKEALRSLPSANKNDLARLTGLSVATCGNILSDLLETKEVFEIELAPSTGGRPSRQFSYNKEYSTIACIYISSNKNDYTLFYTVYNLLGEIKIRNKMTKENFSIADIQTFILELHSNFQNLKVISIGFPGVIQDSFIEICDIKAFKNTNLLDLLPDSIDISIVGINDVNAMLYGFYKTGDFSKEDTLSYIYYPINTCPGSAMLFNGKIITGHTSFAGEISYLPLGLSKGDNILEGNIAKSIACINCIINPINIVIAGEGIEHCDFEALNKAIKKITPNNHIPHVIQQLNPHQDYMDGLLHIGLEQLNIGVDFISD